MKNGFQLLELYFQCDLLRKNAASAGHLHEYLNKIIFGLALIMRAFLRLRFSITFITSFHRHNIHAGLSSVISLQK